MIISGPYPREKMLYTMTRVYLGLCVSTLNICLIFAAGGCFDEIITNPGATASSSSSGTMTTDGATTSTTSIVTSATMIPDDGDTESSTGVESSSSGGVDPLGGVCPEVEHDCGDEPWKLAPCEGCEALSSIAECVLTDLSSAAGGMFTTLRCEPECTLDRHILRPGGPDVLIESLLLDGDEEPVEIIGRKICSRVDLQYFSTCVMSYTEECSDPATWFTSCVDSEATDCPFIDRL